MKRETGIFLACAVPATVSLVLFYRMLFTFFIPLSDYRLMGRYVKRHEPGDLPNET